MPQGRTFPQTPEHVSIGSKQLSRCFNKVVFPQWQVLIFPGNDSHSPQGPGWQISLQKWLPQRSGRPQMELHEKTPSIPSNLPLTDMSPQRTISLFFMQKQEAPTRTWQGRQGPEWQMSTQRWRPQESSRLHCKPQDSRLLLSAHLRTKVFLPQGQGRLGENALQGGHGPGWHWSTHE